jgi:hypothetical protein
MNAQELLALIDKETAEMSPEDAVEFLEVISVEIDVRCEALEDEIDEGDGADSDGGDDDDDGAALRDTPESD